MRISKNEIPFRKGCKPQLIDEVFEISTISTKKPKYIIKNFEKEGILRNLHEKELRKC